MDLYLALLRGVYLATHAVDARGALLPHPFTLTDKPKFAGGLLSAALSVGSAPQVLPGTLSCGARTFLPLVERRASDCPADSSRSEYGAKPSSTSYTANSRDLLSRPPITHEERVRKLLFSHPANLRS